MKISNPLPKLRIVTGAVFLSFILQSELISGYPRSWSSIDLADVTLFASVPALLFIWSLISIFFERKLQNKFVLCMSFLIIVHIGYVYTISMPSFAFIIPFIIDGLLVTFYWPVFRGKSIEFARMATIVLVAGPAIALMTWSTSTIWFASASARDVAAGGPFCIALGEGNRIWIGGQYKTTTSLRDLQGLVMQAPQQQGGTSSYYFTFNAVEITVLDRQLIYWNCAHRNLRFERIEHQDLWRGLAGACKPELNFLDHLSW